MDQFVTTMRRDYLWPYVQHFGRKLVEPQNPLKRERPCPCLKKDASKDSTEKDPQDWSREGPLGELLDPKLFPVKLSKCPQPENVRINQPDVFLKMLHDKYPYLYEVLKSAPDSDMIVRVDKDRLRTTYQRDYCHLGEAPFEDEVDYSDDPCAKYRRSPAFKLRDVTKSYREPEKTEEIGLATKQKKRVVNKTEYEDNVSKLGGKIMKQKLHDRPPKIY